MAPRIIKDDSPLGTARTIADDSPVPSSPPAEPDDPMDVEKHPPGYIETAARGLGQGALAGWGDEAMALQAAPFGFLAGKSMGEMYDATKEMSRQRREAGENENPITAGVSMGVGTVAPIVASGGFGGAGFAAGRGALAASEGLPLLARGAQVARAVAPAVGVGAAQGAAGGAHEGIGGALKGAAIGGATALLPGSVQAGIGVGMGAKTLMDPTASRAQKAEALTLAAVPLAAHGATLAGRAVSKVAGIPAKAAQAEGELRTQIADEGQAARQKHAADVAAAVKDVERQRAATDKQNLARIGADDAAFKHAQNEGSDEWRAQAQGVINKRAYDYDQQSATHRNAVAAERAKRVAENHAQRLAALDHADEMANANTDYDAAKAVWDEAVSQAGDLNDKAKLNANRTVALSREQAKLRAAYAKEQATIAEHVAGLEGLGPEDVDASIAGKIGEMFRETHTRLSNLIAGSERHGLPVDPQYVDLHRYLTETLNKNTPSKVRDLIEFRQNPEAVKARWRAEMQQGGATTESGEQSAPPDFAQQAEENVAGREKAKASDAAEYDAALAAERTKLGAKAPGPAPAKPNDDAYQQGIRDFVRKKLKAGPTPLPPKPDPIAKRVADRATRSRARDAIATNRAAPMPSRSDNGLILDKRPSLDPLTDKTPDASFPPGIAKADPSQVASDIFRQRVSEGGFRLRNTVARGAVGGAIKGAATVGAGEVAGLPVPAAVTVPVGAAGGAVYGGTKALMGRLAIDPNTGKFAHPDEVAAALRALQSAGGKFARGAGTAGDVATRAQILRFIADRKQKQAVRP